MLFKVVTSRKAIAVQEVMQNSQNVKNSLPTEYLCRTSKGLCLQQFHFRLTIATFRKPVLNIFSSYRRKSLDKKEIKHIRGTSFPLA